MNEELHDPFILDYHFMATFSNIVVDDSEVEKSTIEVVFKAYPYMISNMKYEKNVDVDNATVSAKVRNNSSHRITPTFKSDIPFTVVIGDTRYSVPAGETTDDSIKFAVGVNEIGISATGSGTVNISFYEEVF